MFKLKNISTLIRRTSSVLVLILIFIICLVIFCTNDDSGRISNTILFLTGIIIAYYTYETFQLRKQSQITQKNEFLPIINLDEECYVKNDSIWLGIKNMGKGVARNIIVNVHGHVIIKGATLAPGESNCNNPSNTLVKYTNQNIIPAKNNLGIEELNMSIYYYDIYERKSEINGIKFIKNNDGKFLLEKGTWKYNIEF